MNLQRKLLRKLLIRGGANSRLWTAWISLSTGTVLLLLAVMIWWNFQQLLWGGGKTDTLGSTFLTISKKVTDENMGKPEKTIFDLSEIRALQSLNGVQDVGVLTSNRFPAYITLRSTLGFSSEIFLESVPDAFIDKKPDGWYWAAGSREVPIILSKEFLNLYNYGFAISQGLPQLSESSIQSLSFDLVLGGSNRRETFSARVAGFSDRITSVLVPQGFMDFANQTYGKTVAPGPSRLIVSISDPSNKQFTEYLEKNNYNTNSEQLKWNRLRSIVEAIAIATGLLALLLMGISILGFVLFIELTIARAQQSLTLLAQIGYHPSVLKRFMLSRFLPIMLAAIALAFVVAAIAQWVTSELALRMKLELSAIIGYPVLLAALLSGGLLVLLVRNAISRALRHI